jgi:ketosteroid isomerase-like protein
MSEISSDAIGLLLDRMAISDLLIDFARRVDAKDFAGYAANFTDDGVFELPWSRREGRADIAAGAEADLAPFAALQHYSVNHVIEIDGDTATSRSYLLAIHVPDAADLSRHQDAGGWYDSEFRRTPDGWRFTRSSLTVRWTGGAALDFAE